MTTLIETPPLPELRSVDFSDEYVATGADDDDVIQLGPEPIVANRVVLRNDGDAVLAIASLDIWNNMKLVLHWPIMPSINLKPGDSICAQWGYRT